MRKNKNARIENILQFIKDPQLIHSDLSPHQETALALQYGLPLNKEQKIIAQQALDTEDIPQREFNEATYICGRRSGKSDRLAANIAVYEAACGGHEKHLTAGERGQIVLLAQDKRAAGVLYRYIRAKLENSPLLCQLIEDVRKEAIDLTNQLTISIFPCSFRATRGFSIPVAILDEVAFFRVEGVNVDKEVIDAIRPAQATFPNSKLIKISSPYAKQGELYRDFAERHKRSDLLCFRAPSWLMNPTISMSFLENEKERDPEYFEREYAAKFSDSVSSALAREAVEACVVPDRFELPYCSDFRYIAAVDPAGGGPDEFTLVICHRERSGKVIQDLIRGWRNTRPGDVVAEAATLLKTYKCRAVTGDRYSAEWVRQAFQDRGIRYLVSQLTASDSFLELIPLINQAAVELLDDKRQTAQLIALERRTSRTGKDNLGHPPGEHDDRANALAHAARLAAKRRRDYSVVWPPRNKRRRLSSISELAGRIGRPYPAPPVILANDD